MKKLISGLILGLVTSSACAEVVTLECKGSNANGENETVTVQYDETKGWVKDNMVLAIRDGVSADKLTGFMVIVDRKTGEYRTNRPDSPSKAFTGHCELMQRKF